MWIIIVNDIIRWERFDNIAAVDKSNDDFLYCRGNNIKGDKSRIGALITTELGHRTTRNHQRIYFHPNYALHCNNYVFFQLKFARTFKTLPIISLYSIAH